MIRITVHGSEFKVQGLQSQRTGLQPPNTPRITKQEIIAFANYHAEPNFVHIIGQFMKAYILDQHIRGIMETCEFSELATNPRFNMRDLKELDGWRDPVVEYVKNYVLFNAFL